jgi:hypothetical protein
MKRNLFNDLIKKLCLTLSLSAAVVVSNAQPASSYGFTALSGTYTTISGGTELFEVEDDDMSSYSMIPIGFAFNFCGTNYTTCKVNSNGWVSFADVFPQSWEMRENETYNLSLMTPMLQPLWDDLAGYSGICKYETTGTTPNQVFTIEWRGWTWFWYLGYETISFQVKLYETTNVIEFVYQQEPGQLDGFSEAATIGIANTDTDFQTLDNSSTNPTPSSSIFYNYIFQKPATGQVYRWSPPPPCTGTPNAGTATVATSSFPCEGSTTLGLTGNTIATAFEYQWQYSTDNVSWSNLGGVQTNIAASTGTITQTTYFRAIVTCTSSTLSDTSNSAVVTITAPVPGSASATPPLICSGGTSIISLLGATTAGVNYQWQSSTDNVSFTNVSGTGSTYSTPAISTPTYYQAILTCAGNGLTSTSTSALVDTLSSAAPPVNPSSLSVACGSPAILSATPVTGGTIAWYTQSVGGTPVATGNTVYMYPNANTTYYAENSIPVSVTGISTTGATIIDHYNETGWDYSTLTASSNYIYYTGGFSTGRYNKSDLSGGTVLNFREGFFGDLSTGQLWQLSNSWYLGGSFSGWDVVENLYALDESLNPTGTIVTLSQAIYMGWGSFIAPGHGFVILYDGFDFYHVELSSGIVTYLGMSSGFLPYMTSSFASSGWAEFDGSSYNVVFREDWPSQNISKYNIASQTVTVLQSFTDLSNMATIIYDQPTSRMYFHHTGASQFGGVSETLGYLSVTATGSCGNNARTPVQVTVTPGPLPTINPTGTVNICGSGSQLLTASAGAAYQWYENGNPISGAINQTYSTSTAGNFTVEVTTNLGCTSISLPTTVTVTPPQVPSVSVVPSPNDTSCIGQMVNFNATPTNAGTNPSYQWKKNGLNVGINSPLYTGTGLVTGDMIEVVMTVGTGACVTTNTANSNVITMTVQANTVPAVTIAASPGTNACVDDIVTFTATPTNGGTTPAYQWTINGLNAGTNSPTLTVPAGQLSSGDVVNVVMTPSLICSSPATASNSVAMTVSPLTSPTVSIAASSMNICQGDPVTFTATDNAPGGSYQWYINGIPSGPNSANYTFSPGFTDVVTVDFTPPAAGCYDNITVGSNSVSVTVTPGLPTSADIMSVGSTTEGAMVTIYANLFNFNTNFTIDWYINSALYTTTTVPFMSYVKGAGTDVIWAVVNNSGTGCYLSSNSDTISINGWPTSVANISGAGGIEVFPNPFNNQLTIKGLADGDQIVLYNMLGQTLKEWKLEKVADEQQIMINDLASGSYLLNIKDKDGNFRDMKKLQKL